MEMNQKFINDFKEVLEERGYSGHYQSDNRYKSINGHRFWCVEVKNEKNFVVQVFVLMRNSYRTRNKRYPIWESYHQTVIKNCPDVNPAVFIVTQDEGGKWHVYSAGDTSDQKDFNSIVNYNEACDRFDNRVAASKKIGKMIVRLKWISWSFATLLLLYLIAYVTTNMSGGLVFPLTSQMVLLIGLIIILLLLPIVFPYIKSVSLNGIDLFLKGD